MSPATPLGYTRIELESYLPNGWRLPEGDGDWDPATGAWRITVRDGVGFDWTLSVRAADAAEQGRLPALRAAMDELYRERLGKGTRGLGVSRGGRAA
jgi:hypothetical protein